MDELIQELKDQGVLKSPYVEAAFRAVDRKDFVLLQSRFEAYGNYPLPIGGGQTISQPYTVAFMLDLLDPKPGERILDIGAGSGWQSALLAHVVSQKGGVESLKLKVQSSGRVVAVERIPELCELARSNIEKYGFIKNGAVRLVCADATQDLRKYGPVDKIIAAAAARGDIPPAWRKQLKVGGRIVAPVDDNVRLYIKKSEDQWKEKEYPGFAFVPLIAGKAEKSGRSPKAAKQKLWSALFILYLVFAASFLVLAYATFVPLEIAAPIEVEIPSGAGSRVIGTKLRVRKIIRSKWAFVTFATVSGKANQLKPGRYQFEGTVAVPEVLRQIAKGERYPNERVITVPEGWDGRDMGEYFEKAGLFKREEWWRVVGQPAIDYRRRKELAPPQDFSGDFVFLRSKPQYVGLEGFLFPDTYRIFRDAAAEDVARKMLKNFDAKLMVELREAMAQQKKSIFDAVTLASIIEKEIPHSEERKIASGILWRRLELGMPLQADATVNYITGRRETPSSSDLALNSLYNTYRYAGLPLGPIANPGLDAITAAIFPEKSEYLYYLSTPDGRTVFSRTLAEHNAAKAKYLQ